LTPEYSTTFYDEQLVDSIKSYYSEDFALLDFVSISSISKVETIISEDFPVMKEINKQRAAKKSNERKSYRDFFGF
jgi:hypothetical protein